MAKATKPAGLAPEGKTKITINLNDSTIAAFREASLVPEYQGKYQKMISDELDKVAEKLRKKSAKN